MDLGVRNSCARGLVLGAEVRIGLGKSIGGHGAGAGFRRTSDEACMHAGGGWRCLRISLHGSSWSSLELPQAAHGGRKWRAQLYPSYCGHCRLREFVVDGTSSWGRWRVASVETTGSSPARAPASIPHRCSLYPTSADSLLYGPSYLAAAHVATGLRHERSSGLRELP